MLTTVDLFAGAGGLSYGFECTGKFRIVAAAEKNPSARKTYRRNHKGVRLYEDVHDIDYSDIIHDFGSIDVVIGGPPCQGFSNANRQHTTLTSTNNSLVKEFVRAICELRPKVFLMENVAMLRSHVHRFFVDESDMFDEIVMRLPMTDDRIELLPPDAMFPEAVQIACEASQEMEHCWSDKRYTVFNGLYRYRINRAKFDSTIAKYRNYLEKELPLMAQQDSAGFIPASEVLMARQLQLYMSGESIEFESVVGSIKIPLFIQRMIKNLQEIVDNQIHVFDYQEVNGSLIAFVKSYAVLDYIIGTLGSQPYGYQIVPRVYNAADYGAPQKRERYILVGISPDIGGKFVPPSPQYVEMNYRTVRDAIGDLEEVEPSTEVTNDAIPLRHRDDLSPLARMLRGSMLYNHVCTASTTVAQERFSALREGQNFHDLDASLKTTYSNAERTQNTIYMRLCYDLPSGTVVNVRKSMWVHPVLDRAVSIREAARLQTFPDSYVFEGSKDSQYQQVGNAVPPILAKAIAIQILKAVGD